MATFSSGSYYDGPFLGDGEQQPTNWTLGRIIARGKLTRISHVARGPTGTKKCAVKQMIISDDHNSKTLKSIDDEMRLLKKVKHHRINDYFGFSRTTRTLSLFIAYLEKGTLAKYLHTQKDGGLSEEKTALFTYQILEGLEYLHKEKIIHRDIKGSNILMQDDYNIKISDFGVSKILNTISRASTREKETINWMAPEALQSKPSYSFEVDIWSLGCTVYQLITGKIPFEELEEHDIVYNARQNQHELSIPDYCSPNLKDFLSQACTKVGKDRPTASELKKHAFLIENIDETSVMIAAEPKADVEQDVYDGPSLLFETMPVNKQDAPIRGSLLPDHEMMIQKRYNELREELDAEVILPYMYQQNIMTREDMETIKAEKTTARKTEKFLAILFRSGRGAAFDVFIDALQETYPHIATKILSTTTL